MIYLQVFQELVRTAIGLIANLPDICKFKCAKQLTAFAGLNPSINESGSSVRGLRSISKTGSKNLRNVLFMPALVSKKCCKPMFNFAERIIKKGKKAKVALIAVMHKLIRIIFAVLKKGEKFNESMINSEVMAA
jgi:transposase